MLPPSQYDLQYLLQEFRDTDHMEKLVAGRIVASKCATRALGVISVRNCTRDGGRPPGIGLQEQTSNHLKLRWLRARVVSVKGKSRHKIAAGVGQGDERKRTTDEVSKHWR
jgi:hypothetical protein